MWPRAAREAWMLVAVNQTLPIGTIAGASDRRDRDRRGREGLRLVGRPGDIDLTPTEATGVAEQFPSDVYLATRPHRQACAVDEGERMRAVGAHLRHHGGRRGPGRAAVRRTH